MVFSCSCLGICAEIICWFVGADPFIIKRSRQGHDERSLHPRVLGSFAVREVARLEGQGT